jgi:hypothetical protein
MRTLTINCFNFTMGTPGIINDGTEIKLAKADSIHIYQAAQEYGIEKVYLIGPPTITQRIIQELITDYKYFEVSSILG